MVTRNVAKLVRIPTARYKVGKGLRVADVKRLLVEAKQTRLYGLYLVAATLGLRRGELLGLRWANLDLDRGTLTVEQTVQRVGGRLVLDEAKSEASEGTILLSKITRRVLLAHRDLQDKERVDVGEIWHDYGLVFPTSVGTPIEPRSLNRHFTAFAPAPSCPTSDCTTSGTPWSRCCWSWARRRTS